MKVTDEIDKIKKEGIDNVEYDSDGNIRTERGTLETLQASSPNRNTQAETFWNEPIHVGDYYPEEFGESKYDKNIPN